MAPFADIAIKGALLLTFAATASLALRDASAGTRSLVWSSGLIALLLLAPVVAIAPAWQVPLLPAAPTAEQPAAEPSLGAHDPAAPTAEHQTGEQSSGAHHPASAPRPSSGKRGSAAPPVVAESTGQARSPRLADLRAGSPSVATRAASRPERHRATPARSTAPTLRSIPIDWGLTTWAAVAAGLLAYLGIGAMRARQLTRRAAPVEDPDLLARFGRAAAEYGVRERVQLLETDEVVVPVTWHLGRASVIVPTAAKRWPADRQAAVLMHELAHVGRQDCRVQILARLAVAVHWFNPLAWFALARLRHERERACDDVVLRSGVRPSAYATHLVEIGRAAIGVVPSPVTVELVRPNQLRARVTAILDSDTGRQSPNRSITVSIVAIALSLFLPLAALQPVAAAGPEPEPAPPAEPAPAPTAGPFASTSPAAAQAAAPSLDDLVQMRIHGVSPEFIEQMRTLLGAPLDIDDLVQMRIHGVSPEYVGAMRAEFGDLDLGDLVQGRIHGISAEYAADMRGQHDGLDFDDLVQGRIHGISSEYARALGAELGAVRFEDLVQGRIHGLSAEYARAMRGTFGDLDIDDLVQGRIHGLSAEYAGAMSDVVAGVVEFDDLVQMRIHGVGADKVRELTALLPGEELDVETLVQMAIHGVTPDMIRRLQEAGYEDLTAQELIDIRIHGTERLLLRRRGDQR